MFTYNLECITLQYYRVLLFIRNLHKLLKSFKSELEIRKFLFLSHLNKTLQNKTKKVLYSIT